MTSSNRVLHFDYETFSEVNLKQVGAHVYARHPSTRIICVAWALGDDDVQLIREGDDPRPFIRALKHADHYAGHNVNFEYLITKHVAPRQWGVSVPPIKPSRLICTAAISSYRGLPRSLEHAAAAANVGEHKDPRGQKLINKLCKPRRPSLKNPDERWTPETAPKDFDDFYEYCKQDVRTERALHSRLGDLPVSEYYVWQRDFRMNHRGIPINVRMLKRAIKCRDIIVAELERAALKGKPFQTLGQRAVVMQWCEDNGYPLPDYTAPTLEASVNDPDCPPVVRQVLRARQQCSRTSLKKFDAMLRALCPDNTVKGCHVYHGAHTGRWAGALIQPQNLPRPTISEAEITKAFKLLGQGKYLKFLEYDDPTGVLVSCIRGLIQPEEGLRMFASDFSNVEGRVLFAVAGDRAGLRVFRSGLDLYIDMASKIFNTTYDRIYDEYVGGNDYKRRVGKLAILGLGYQMGWEKFQATSAEKGVHFDEDFARAVVEAYRAAYPQVQQLWKDCEDAAKNAVVNPGTTFKVNEYLSYKVSGSTLLCQLPSRRRIHYPFPKIEDRKTPWGGRKPTLTYMTYEKGQFRRVKTFGGSLVENAIQGACRDLLTNAEEYTTASGYDTRMTVHDELVMTTDRPDASCEEVTHCMVGHLPEYARRWPIEAKTWEGPRFRKD